MPFHAINWGGIANSLGEVPIEEVHTRLPRTFRPSALLLQLTGPFFLQYPLPKRKSFRYLAYVHRAVAAAAAALLILNLVYYCAFTTSLSTPSNLVRLLLLTQAALAPPQLLMVQFRFRKFYRLISIATTGVGTVRLRKTLRRVYVVVFIASGVCFVFALTAFSLDFLGWFGAPARNASTLDTISFALSAYSFAPWLAWQSTAAAHIAAVLLEFRSLNEDMGSDGNFYQLPVLRHYCSIHTKLQNAIAFLNTQLLLLLPLSLGALPITILIPFLVPLKLSDSLPFAAGMCVVLSQFLIFALLTLATSAEASKIAERIRAVSAEDRHLESDFRVLGLSFSLTMSNRFTVLGLFPVSKEFMFTLLVGAVFLGSYLRSRVV